MRSDLHLLQLTGVIGLVLLGDALAAKMTSLLRELSPLDLAPVLLDVGAPRTLPPSGSEANIHRLRATDCSIGRSPP